MKLLDESEPNLEDISSAAMNFQKPLSSFQHEESTYTQWEENFPSKRSKLTIDKGNSIPPAGAKSFVVPELNTDASHGTRAALRIKTDQPLEVSIVSKNTNFKGRTLDSGYEARNFTVTDETVFSYADALYDTEGDNQIPELFVTLVNADLEESVTGIEVEFILEEKGCNIYALSSTGDGLILLEIDRLQGSVTEIGDGFAVSKITTGTTSIRNLGDVALRVRPGSSFSSGAGAIGSYPEVDMLLKRYYFRSGDEVLEVDIETGEYLGVSNKTLTDREPITSAIHGPLNYDWINLTLSLRDEEKGQRITHGQVGSDGDFLIVEEDLTTKEELNTIVIDRALRSMASDFCSSGGS
jgi:hypothetical protein